MADQPTASDPLLPGDQPTANDPLLLVDQPAADDPLLLVDQPTAHDPLLRRKEVERLTGLSRPTIYRQIKKGTFPAPRRIGVQAVAWFASEIAEWQRRRPVVSGDS